MRERWLCYFYTVIIQVSGSKFTLNHGFMDFCLNLVVILCRFWYILHAGDRNLSLDMIGCWFVLFSNGVD